MAEIKKTNAIPAVLMSFIIMGFVDIVGVSTGYAQRDFNLSSELAQLLPSMVFIWFLLLSVPVGILQNNFGKKKMLVLGIFLTMVGMFTPLIHYTYPLLLVSFIFLGIGNTIIQVSANPLLQEVVLAGRLASYMSLSQFIKAISSLMGPVIVTVMVTNFSNWKLVFLVYGITSIISAIWLIFTPIEEKFSEERASLKSTFKLLSNKFILLMVIAIFLIVGLDVGINTNIQNLLVRRYNISLENASLGISLYFLSLIISRLVGAIILSKINNKKFLLWSSLAALISIILLLFTITPFITYTLIFMVGLFSGNFFPLVFSIAISKLPERSNEISGLMIMAVVGGAVIPPVIGYLNKVAGLTVGLLVLVLCIFYVFGLSFLMRKKL